MMLWSVAPRWQPEMLHGSVAPEWRPELGRSRLGGDQKCHIGSVAPEWRPELKFLALSGQLDDVNS